MVSSSTAVSVVRSSLAAAAGWSGALFPAAGQLPHATLRFDDQARFPGAAELTRRGGRCEIVVRLAPPDDSGIGSVCVKFPNLYGSGLNQDFLFASSADGAPLHHIALPVKTDAAQLYSSLWLYLAGIVPVLFGVRTHARPEAPGPDGSIGAELHFLVSPPVGNVREIGVITVGEKISAASGVRFAAKNCGGNLRALPPVRFYRDS